VAIRIRLILGQSHEENGIKSQNGKEVHKKRMPIFLENTIVICGDMLSSCSTKSLLEELVSYGYLILLKSEFNSSKKYWFSGDYLDFDRIEDDGSPSWTKSSCHDKVWAQNIPDHLKFFGFVHALTGFTI
jgi:hypothetical protein